MDNVIILSGVNILITVYIAYQQWKINALKLKSDLYDRKLKLFDAAMVLYEDMSKEQIVIEDCYKFKNNTKCSPFLFGEIIVKHLEVMYNKGVLLYQHSQNFDRFDLGSHDIARINTVKHELLDWFKQDKDNTIKLFINEIRLNITFKDWLNTWLPVKK